MKLGPVVGGADESEHQIQSFQMERSERAPQGVMRLRGIGSLKKNVRGAREESLFPKAVEFRKRLEGTIKTGADREKRQHILSSRKGTPKQRQNCFYPLRQ